MKRLFTITLLGLSLALSIILAAAWIWSHSNEMVISKTSGGTYRELRTSRGRWSYLEAAGALDDAPLTWDRSLDAATTIALPGKTDVLPMREHKSLFLTATNDARIWPVQRSDGRMTIGYSDVVISRQGSGRLLGTMPGSSMTITGMMVAKLAPSTQSTITIVQSGVRYPTSQPIKETILPPTTPPTLTLPSLTAAPTSQQPPKTQLASTLNSLKLTLNGPVSMPSGMQGMTSITISGGAVLTISPGIPYERYVMPMWLPLVIAMSPMGAVVLAALRLRRRTVWRRRNGLCFACGYDLRGGGSDACPECGVAPAQPSVA